MLTGAVQLLQECSQTLPGSRELLLDLICTLAQDEWQSVSSPCLQWLHGRPLDADLVHGAVLTSGTALQLAQRLLGDVSTALHRGEVQGTLHCRRLMTALQVQLPSQPCCQHAMCQPCDGRHSCW